MYLILTCDKWLSYWTMQLQREKGKSFSRYNCYILGSFLFKCQWYKLTSLRCDQFTYGVIVIISQHCLIWETFFFLNGAFIRRVTPYLRNTTKVSNSGDLKLGNVTHSAFYSEAGTLPLQRKPEANTFRGICSTCFST